MNAPALHNVAFRLGGQAVPIVIEEFESMILEDYDYAVCRILRKDRGIAVLQYCNSNHTSNFVVVFRIWMLLKRC